MASTRERPNILLIMPDQMRGDCMSLAGHPVLVTPNIDQIGGAGAYFTQAYSSCASCIAARRSLLTGQFPSTHGMVGYREGVPLKSPVLTRLLSDSGYATAIVGRYMHQWPYDEPYGFEKRVLGSIYILHDDYARTLEREAPMLGGIRGLGMSYNGWHAAPWPLPEYLHPTNWTVQQARGIIADHGPPDPLFLVCSFYSPHPPLIPPVFHMDRFLQMELPAPAIGDWAKRPPNDGLGAGVDAHRVCLEGERLRRAQAGYFGLISHIDDHLYWLIHEFKEKSRSMKRPWVIVFTSDHGEMLGDHYFFRKCEPYAGGSLIPFLVQGSPELGLKAGVVCRRPVCLEDIMPTLLELAGLPVPESADGRSLVPTLRGADDEVRPYLHGEHAPCYSQEQAYHFLTDGSMKYVWRPLDGSEQLFDLERDPRELHDLAQDGNAHAVQPWRNRLIQHLGGRAEGFTDGQRLIAGRPYDAVLPHASDVQT